MGTRLNDRSILSSPSNTITTSRFVNKLKDLPKLGTHNQLLTNNSPTFKPDADRQRPPKVTKMNDSGRKGSTGIEDDKLLA
jgi:hypothetical protein